MWEKKREFASESERKKEAKLHVVFDVKSRDRKSCTGAKFMHMCSTAFVQKCSKTDTFMMKTTTATTRSCTLIHRMKMAHENYETIKNNNRRKN